MAITTSYPNINVRIGSQGAFLKEYEDEGQDELRENLERASIPDHVRQRTTPKYIESKTDAHFDIILTVEGAWTYGCGSLGFEVLVDGRHIETTICLPSHFINGSWTHIISGEMKPSMETGVTVLRRFKFSGITLVDDHKKARVQEDAKRILDIGSIIVKVYRMGQGQEKAMRPVQSQQPSVPTVDTVSEKALKGQVLSHAVAFGEQERLNVQRSLYNAVPIDGSENPMAVYRFRYRSSETLKTLSIITHSEDPPQRTVASLSSTTNSDPLAGMSLPQLEKLAQEQLANTEISNLTLEELETLAVEQRPTINLSKLTLRDLKAIANYRLIRKRDTVGDLPYDELKRLASERLKTLGSNSEKVMPTETRTTISSNATFPTNTNRSNSWMSTTNSQRSSGLDAHERARIATSMGRPTSHNTSSRSSLLWKEPLSKESNPPKGPSPRITNPHSKKLTRTERIVSTLPLHIKNKLTPLESSLLYSLVLYEPAYPEGFKFQRICQIQKSSDPSDLLQACEGLEEKGAFDESIFAGGLEKLRQDARMMIKTSPKTKVEDTSTPQPQNSKSSLVESKSEEKPSSSSMLREISGNRGSKRGHEDDSILEKPDRPYKVIRKRSGAIILDLTNDDD